MNDYSYVGHKFFHRKEGRQQEDHFLLGEELVNFMFVKYRPSYRNSGRVLDINLSFKGDLVAFSRGNTGHIPGDTSLVLRVDNRTYLLDPPRLSKATDVSCVGHQFAVKQEDSIAIWKELTEYLKQGCIPPRFEMDRKEKKVFEARAKLFT
jgi:hypothetical protein